MNKIHSSIQEDGCTCPLDCPAGKLQPDCTEMVFLSFLSCMVLFYVMMAVPAAQHGTEQQVVPDLDHGGCNEAEGTRGGLLLALQEQAEAVMRDWTLAHRDSQANHRDS